MLLANARVTPARTPGDKDGKYCARVRRQAENRGARQHAAPAHGVGGGGVSSDALSAAAGSERRSTVAMVWGVLARMLAEPPAEPGLPGRQAALLRGARRHLEAGHAAHMHATVQANRHLARPAGPEAGVYGGLCPE